MKRWLGSSAACAVLLVACGDDSSANETSAAEVESEETAERTGEETAEGTGEETVDTAAPNEEAAAPAGAEVDLLGAVGTELAVSSAYRDRLTEVPRLFDGDLETAWNSASGEATDSWIEVRVPDGATVTAIEMTAGYTRVARNDLFTGNHRITKVRVTKDGEELVVHDLDPESRELQRIPAAGGPGVYRVEVAEVRPGERDDWTETCVSELRVLGRAGDAAEGTRFPRYAIGSLPPRPQLPARDEGWAEDHRQRAHRAVDRILELETAAIETASASGGVDEAPSSAQVQPIWSHRNAVFDIVEPLVAHDAIAADTIRRARALSRSEFHSFWAQWKRETLPAIDAALQRAATGDDEARCRWAKGYVKVLVNRVYEAAKDDIGASSPYWALEGIRDDFSRDTDRHLRTLRQLERDEEGYDYVDDDLDAMDAQLALLAEGCVE